MRVPTGPAQARSPANNRYHSPDRGALAPAAKRGTLTGMIRARIARAARLLAVSPILVACVFDGLGETHGARGSAGAVDTTAMASTGTDAVVSTSSSTGDDLTTGSTTVDPGDSATSTSAGSSTGTTTTLDATTGSTGEDPPDELRFETDIQPILSDNCACHSDGEPSPDLGAGRAYERIVRVPAQDVKSMALIEPNSREYSYLWHKIAGTHDEVGGDGKRMPPNDLLLDADMELIRTWIDQGALP